MQAWNELCDMCFTNAHKIYGRLLPKGIEKRLTEELTAIREKGWAQAFLEVSRFMTGECFTSDDDFNKGFRGCLGTSFVAYLCHITTLNPMECEYKQKMMLHAPMFTEQTKLMFYINLPQRIVDKIEREGIKVPDCLQLFSSDNLTLLDELQRVTGEKFMCRPSSDMDSMMKQFFPCFVYGMKNGEGECVASGKALAGFFPEFAGGREMFLEIVKKMERYEMLPTNVSDMARVLGLMHGSGTWIGNGDEMLSFCCKMRVNDYDLLITCAEDVYEYLVRRMIPETEALRIVEHVRKGNSRVTTEDKAVILRNLGTTTYIESMEKINHLFYRAQCIQYAMETMRLIYYFIYHNDKYVACVK